MPDAVVMLPACLHGQHLSSGLGQCSWLHAQVESHDMWYMHVMFGLSIKVEKLPARGEPRHTAKPIWLAHHAVSHMVWCM